MSVRDAERTRPPIIDYKLQFHLPNFYNIHRKYSMPSTMKFKAVIASLVLSGQVLSGRACESDADCSCVNGLCIDSDQVVCGMINDLVCDASSDRQQCHCDMYTKRCRKTCPPDERGGNERRIGYPNAQPAFPPFNDFYSARPTPGWPGPFPPEDDDCPNQWRETPYEPGDLVSVDGVVYQCRSAPLNLQCGQFGYQPGIYNPESEMTPPWTQAWALIGSCNLGEGPSSAYPSSKPTTATPTTAQPTSLPPSSSGWPTSGKSSYAPSAAPNDNTTLSPSKDNNGKSGKSTYSPTATSTGTTLFPSQGKSGKSTYAPTVVKNLFAPSHSQETGKSGKTASSSYDSASLSSGKSGKTASGSNDSASSSSEKSARSGRTSSSSNDSASSSSEKSGKTSSGSNDSASSSSEKSGRSGRTSSGSNDSASSSSGKSGKTASSSNDSASSSSGSTSSSGSDSGSSASDD